MLPQAFSVCHWNTIDSTASPERYVGYLDYAAGLNTRLRHPRKFGEMRFATRGKGGEFIVTMEHPSESQPKPLVIEIDQFQATVKRTQAIGAAAVASVRAPRAG